MSTCESFPDVGKRVDGVRECVLPWEYCHPRLGERRVPGSYRCDVTLFGSAVGGLRPGTLLDDVSLLFGFPLPGCACHFRDYWS